MDTLRAGAAPSSGLHTILSGRAPHALAFTIYSCVGVLVSRSILPHPAAAYIGGEPGQAAQDPLAFMWFLRWIPYALSHHLNPFLTDWIFSDSGANLAWNTAVPLIGVVMAPVTLSAGPIFSYNLAMVLSLVVSAWCAYYVAFRLFRCGFLPSLLAGAVYGFSPFEAAQAIGHLHMTPAFAPPMFMLILHDILIAQRRSPWVDGSMLAALAVAQYFVSPEVLLTACITATAAVCLLLVWQGHAVSAERARYALSALSLAVIVMLPFLSYPLYLTFFGPWRPSHPFAGAAGARGVDLFGFLVPSSSQWISGALSVPAGSTAGEWNSYLGVALLMLLGVIGYVMREDGATRFLLAMAGAVALITLGSSLYVGGAATGIPLPWRLFVLVPFFRDVLPSRFGEYLYLFVGLALARYLADKFVSRRGQAVRVGAVLAAAAFLFPRIPLYPATYVDVPDLFRLPCGAQDITSPALVVPLASVTDAKAMLWQAEACMSYKMPEGYAYGQGKGPWPSPTVLAVALVGIEESGRAPAVTPAFQAQARRVLLQQGIKTVVVGPCRHQREALTFLAEVLGRSPDAVGGAFVWRQVDRRL